MAVRIMWETTPPAILDKALRDHKAWTWLSNGANKQEVKHPTGVIIRRINGTDNGQDGTTSVRISVHYAGHIIANGTVYFDPPSTTPTA